MYWIPFIVAAIAFAAILLAWGTEAWKLHKARKDIPIRILVVGSRGKSGTVRLLTSLLSETGTPTYGKITGTVAEEIDVTGEVFETKRLGPVSASEMSDVLQRADKHNAQAAVLECMAVAPKLIGFVQNRVVRAETVIIPTIRLDHLEDEGDTIVGIAKSILQELHNVKTLITGETNPEVLRVMTWWAKKNHVKFISVAANELTPVADGHHPTNVETALAVAGEYGISREVATQALQKATTEPDANLAWEIIKDGHVMRFSDLGGANDPQSSAEAVLRAQSIAPDNTIIPILVNRWDRPLRSIAFANSLRANPNTPRVGIIGPAIPQVRLALRRQGFRADQIRHIGWRSTLTSGLSLHKLITLQQEHPNAWFVLLENIHAFPADQIRNAVHNHGRPITNGHTHELGADNV